MRVEPINPGDLEEGVAQVYAAIGGSRGHIVDGPFRVWLRANPELAARMNDVGTVLRDTGTLDKRLFEVAVLSVARFWDAKYQWAAHATIAHDAGLAQETIDAIGRGAEPNQATEDERLVYLLTRNLLERKTIQDDLYERVLGLIGFEQLVELVTVIGQYSLAAIVTNGFEIDLSSGGPALPDRASKVTNDAA